MNVNKEEPISERHKIMNERCFQRNIPSSSLQPYLDVRPVMTKYATFPVIDYRKPATVPINQQPVYSPEDTFNPGTDVAPWSGFATNVSIESELRNQTHRLCCSDKNVYVPSSKSDMYGYEWSKRGRTEPNPHIHLQNNLKTIGQNNSSNNQTNLKTEYDYLGEHVFYNSTRL